MADEQKYFKHNRELLQTLANAHGNKPRYARVTEQAEALDLSVKGLPPYAYNASFWRDHRRVWATYRYHPEPKNPFTRIGVTDMQKTQDLLAGDGTSYEDARLFTLHGDPWMSWVEAKWEGNFENPRSIVKYAQLHRTIRHDDPHEPWKLGRVYQTNPGSNDGTTVQKNWVYFEADENLFCIYKSWPEVVVWQVQGDMVINEWKSPGIRWPYGEIRGANIVPYKGRLLRTFHSTTNNGCGRREHRKYVGACLMSAKPPFEVVKLTEKPLLYGSEADGLTHEQHRDCGHWHPGVVFPAGLSLTKTGFVLSAGINDSAIVLLKLTPEKLNL